MTVVVTVAGCRAESARVCAVGWRASAPGSHEPEGRESAIGAVRRDMPLGVFGSVRGGGDGAAGVPLLVAAGHRGHFSPSEEFRV